MPSEQHADREVQTNKKPKLIIVTLSLTIGGAERVICNLCNEALVKQYQVTVISLMHAQPEYPLDASVRMVYLDDTWEQYQQNFIVRYARRRKKLLSCLSALGACKAEGDVPTAILSFLPEPNLMVCSLRRKLACPVIISVRNDPVREYRSFLKQRMMRRQYPKADGYVFQTNQAKAYFQFSEHIYAASIVIPNPLSEKFMGEDAIDVPKRHQVIAAGRLEKQKNPLLLLNAFAKIYKEHPEYELIFYGEGSMKEEIETQVQSLGLSQAVRLPGLAEDMKQAYAQAEIYVLSSEYEGMPNALMEAMAMGLPCIATDCPCGGPAYLIQNGENGILIPVGDEDALVGAMRKLMKDKTYPLRLGIRAKQIRETCAPEQIYQAWLGYIHQVTAKQK